MQSKNKNPLTAREREHVTTVKSMNCVVCDAPGPSDAHELEQGLWWTCIPLCRSCHMDNFNGIHDQKRMWSVYKMDELKALNLTIERLQRE